MRFSYNKDKDRLIKSHESAMLTAYSETIINYLPLFKAYGCFPEVKLFWYNFLTGKCSDECLPFDNGYICYVSCEILQDGKVVEVKSTDGEVDYYSLSAVWAISSVSRSFFKLKVSFCAGVHEDVICNLNDFLSRLKGNYQRKQCCARY